MKVETLAVPFADRVRGDPQLQAIGKLGLRLRTFRHILDTCLPPADGRSTVDLGAGHGLFAGLAKKKGYKVTAVDARLPWTLGDGDRPQDLSGIEVVQHDVRTFDLSGFDTVLIIGLLYHLTFKDQRDLLARCAGRPTVIDTEVFDAAALPGDARDRFRYPVEIDGYHGALVAETGDVWSSYGIDRSFWFSEESLLRFFSEVGVGRVQVVEPAYASHFGPRRWYVLDAGS